MRLIIYINRYIYYIYSPLPSVLIEMKRQQQQSQSNQNRKLEESSSINVIKFVPKSESEFNLIMERATKMSQLEHPNITKIYKCYSTQQKNEVYQKVNKNSQIKYINLHVENNRGKKLGQFIQTLTINQLHHIYAKIVAAIDFLYKNQIQEFDLSNSQIYLDQSLNPKLSVNSFYRYLILQSYDYIKYYQTKDHHYRIVKVPSQNQSQLKYHNNVLKIMLLQLINNNPVVCTKCEKSQNIRVCAYQFCRSSNNIICHTCSQQQQELHRFHQLSRVSFPTFAQIMYILQKQGNKVTCILPKEHEWFKQAFDYNNKLKVISAQKNLKKINSNSSKQYKNSSSIYLSHYNNYFYSFELNSNNRLQQQRSQRFKQNLVEKNGERIVQAIYCLNLNLKTLNDEFIDFIFQHQPEEKYNQQDKAQVTISRAFRAFRNRGLIEQQ